MKLTGKELSIFTALCAALFILAQLQSGVDGMTGATAKSKGDIVLPEKSQGYKVYVTDGLENFSVEYDKNFHRGGTIESIEGAKALRRYKIRTIFSITPDDKERALAKKFGFNLVELEFEFETIPDDILTKFVTTLNTSKGASYAHCHGGSHRAGILGMIYRVVKNGWTVERAEKEFVALGGYPVKDKKILDAAKAFLKEYK